MIVIFVLPLVITETIMEEDNPNGTNQNPQVAVDLDDIEPTLGMGTDPEHSKSTSAKSLEEMTEIADSFFNLELPKPKQLVAPVVKTGTKGTPDPAPAVIRNPKLPQQVRVAANRIRDLKIMLNSFATEDQPEPTKEFLTRLADCIHLVNIAIIGNLM